MGNLNSSLPDKLTALFSIAYWEKLLLAGCREPLVPTFDPGLLLFSTKPVDNLFVWGFV